MYVNFKTLSLDFKKKLKVFKIYLQLWVSLKFRNNNGPKQVFNMFNWKTTEYEYNITLGWKKLFTLVYQERAGKISYHEKLNHNVSLKGSKEVGLSCFIANNYFSLTTENTS